MNLVAYSDSEDDADETSKKVENNNDKPTTHPPGPKRKRSNEDESQPPSKSPPPLPSGFNTLYASTVRSSTNDDPTLHSGRTRQIPHVEGNWPSFVYLEWLPSPQDLVTLEDVISSIAREHTEPSDSHSLDGQVRSSLRSELGVRLPLHVSLSAPLILTTDNKDAFEDDLTQTINSSNLPTFSTVPSSIRWVKNFDSTRHFLILTLTKPKQDDLQSLLFLCNHTATTFHLPQLYARDSKPRIGSTTVGVNATSTLTSTLTPSSNPSKRIPNQNHIQEHTSPAHNNFHISIAWSLTPVHTTELLMARLHETLKQMTITFDTVYIKVGNHVSSVSLRGAPS